MTKFIKLHLRRPRMKQEYKGSRFGVVMYQDGWFRDKIEEIYFNVDNIKSFSDYKVNDIDVCETVDEILMEIENND